MVANVIYVIVLISVVVIFLLIPVGLIARMIFNKVDSSMTAEELSDMEEHIKNLLEELKSVSKENIEKLESQRKQLDEVITLANRTIQELKDMSDFDDREHENETYARIEKLFSTGRTIDDIAREVNMHKGEIQLILGLRELESVNSVDNKTAKRTN